MTEITPRKHPRWYRRRRHADDLAPRRTHPVVHRVDDHPERNGDELTVLTLNIAHGRSRGFHQTLQSTERIRRNLGDIGAMLDRERADVVALQEADGPCFWSGSFDHVGFAAERGGLGWFLRGAHVLGPRLSYGTALLAARPIDEPLSGRFVPTPPTPTKGFVVGAVRFGETLVDVVSVHLDFARAKIRRKQVAELAEALHERGDRPRVVMGDFNCRWTGRELTLHRFAESLGLTPWEPDSDAHPTFGRGKARLDWIFASPALRFVDHRTLPDPLSDHRAVVARLRWA